MRNEKMKKITAKEIKKELTESGFIKVYKGYYIVNRVTEDTFVDGYYVKKDELLNQIKAEQKMNYWFGTYVSEENFNKQLRADSMPIAGRTDKYVTDWLYRNFDEMLENAVKEFRHYNSL